jgi:hypothetical protein
MDLTSENPEILKIVQKQTEDIELNINLKFEYSENDTIYIPVSIGTKSPQRAKELCDELLNQYKHMFSPAKVFIMPHKEDKFYYPVIYAKI